MKERVWLWNTFNEPDTYASLTYLLGGFPPFHKWRLLSYRKSIKHMAAAHVRASEIIRQTGNGGRTPEIGIAKNWTFFGSFEKQRLVGPFARGNFPSCVQSILYWTRFWAGDAGRRPRFWA